MNLTCPICNGRDWRPFDAAVECCDCSYLYRYADLRREYGGFAIVEVPDGWRVLVQGRVRA